MTLKDKVAIVTGSGGGGTGRATACRLAREGALVVVTDLNQSGGHETVSRIESEGGLRRLLSCRCGERARDQSASSILLNPGSEGSTFW